MKYKQRPMSRYQGKRVGDVLLYAGVGVLLLSGLLYLLLPFHLKAYTAFLGLVGGFVLLYWLTFQVPTYTKLLMQRILWIVLAIGLGLFLILEVVLLAGAHDDVAGTPPVMIVLGTRVTEDGPEVLLQDRLDEALDYWAENEDVVIVVSGGQGSDEPATEASVMQAYLVEQGVSPEQILLEEQSSNTSENLIYSLALLETEGYDTEEVLVVSNGFHLTRVRMLWNRVAEEGEELHTLAAPNSNLSTTLLSYIREAPALIKSFVFDR